MQLKQNNIRGYVRNEDCYGCGDCALVCPNSCISMVEDTSGFVYPIVENTKCIDCGKCLKVCIAINDSVKSETKSVYACKTLDDNLLNSSTSGGAFGVIALSILNNGGVVYGAAWDNFPNVRHVAVNTQEELFRLHGSKYVQSNASVCFNDLQKNLDNNVEVLFSGTGCQVAALKSFLKKDYNNLFTVEVVCHGVPSPGLFRRYIQYMSSKHGNKSITSFSFRSKHRRPLGEHSEFYYECAGQECIGYSLEDSFYGSFLKGIILRPICYNCKYKGINRVADYTLGDFWGIEKTHKSFDFKNGVSLMMLNTRSAEEWFENHKTLLYYEKSSYEEAVLSNKAINNVCVAPSVPIDYDSNQLFEKVLKPKKGMMNYVKNRIPWRLKYLFKKMIGRFHLL